MSDEAGCALALAFCAICELGSEIAKEIFWCLAFFAKPNMCPQSWMV